MGHNVDLSLFLYTSLTEFSARSRYVIERAKQAQTAASTPSTRVLWNARKYQKPFYVCTEIRTNLGIGLRYLIRSLDCRFELVSWNCRRLFILFYSTYSLK